jgi:hypothetical protein
MRNLKSVVLILIASFGIAASAPRANAQVSIGIGVAPACPYGYYDAAPYRCAPYGYYGPEWFTNGVFIGAGPWFHGPEHFHGYVDITIRITATTANTHITATGLERGGTALPGTSTETRFTTATAAVMKDTDNINLSGAPRRS